MHDGAVVVNMLLQDAAESAWSESGCSKLQIALVPELGCLRLWHNLVQYCTVVKLGVLLQGVAVVHECGLVHGDLHLGNCMVTMRNDGSDLHLATVDLGSCVPIGTGSASWTSSLQKLPCHVHACHS